MKYDGYFFDLDGTVFLGQRLLPGAAEALESLRAQGKRLLFLSNTTTRTREECYLRLTGLGIQAHRQEMVTAGWMSALYLREQAGEVRVYVIGEPALVLELVEQGVPITLYVEEATHVLVGMDMHFNYDKLHAAAKAVRRGAALIAANPDTCCPVEGDLLPDTWAIVQAIVTASGVRTHAVMGKPSSYFAQKTLEWSGLEASRCLMIGDRLDTDIAFGLKHGLGTALVLTGVSGGSELAASPIRPDYVWASLHELASVFTV
ncbi:haloacid dehalogenase [Paenibacillus sp. CAA11]|nr:haloacid dehalogenase [Paenibacillus sp. CAA11]